MKLLALLVYVLGSVVLCSLAPKETPYPGRLSEGEWADMQFAANYERNYSPAKEAAKRFMAVFKLA